MSPLEIISRLCDVTENLSSIVKTGYGFTRYGKPVYG